MSAIKVTDLKLNRGILPNAIHTRLSTKHSTVPCSQQLQRE